ncbi:MAG: NUDIX hydrolase [Bacteroidota bacterium]
MKKPELVESHNPGSLENPWKTLNAKEIYENPWIVLTEYDVINPAGNPGIYGVVHFKGRAVGVIPYQDGHIWMVGQYRYPLQSYSWEIPEGGSPGSEDLLDTAKRELLEETGLVAKEFKPLFRLHLSNSVTDEWGIIYLATGLEQHEAEPEDTEDLKLMRLSLDEAYEWVESGKITDSLTITAIYKMKLLQFEGKL